MVDVLLLPYPKLRQQFLRDERECKNSQQLSIDNCNRKSGSNRDKCNKDLNKFTVLDCMKAVGAKYFRKIGPMNNFVYPWNNFDWDYTSYVDKNYNSDITGASTTPTMKGLDDNIRALGKIGSGFVFDPNPGIGRKKGDPIKAYGNIPSEKDCETLPGYMKQMCLNNVKNMKSKGYRIPIAGRDDKEDCDGNATCEKIKSIQMEYRNAPPPTDSPMFKNSRAFPLEGKGASSYFVNLGFCKKDSCVTDRMCLGVIFSNNDSLKDQSSINLLPSQYRDLFRRSVKNKTLMYKRFKNDNCNKIVPDLKFTYKTKFCIDDGRYIIELDNVVKGADKLKDFRKWVKSIDEKNYPNGGICYEKKYGYIDNSPGGKIKLRIPKIDFSFDKGFKFSWGPPEIIDIPKGIVPSLFMDFVALNPFNLISVMMSGRGVGLKSLGCDDGRKSLCRIEGLSENGEYGGINEDTRELVKKYARVMNNKFLYILFWAIIIYIIFLLIKNDRK